MSTAFWDAIKARRSIYALSAASPIPDSKIVELVEEAVKHAPSSFNSQSSRTVVVFGEEHKKVWQFAKDAIKAIVPAEAYPASEARLNGFQNAYGTVLLFEDRDVISGLQKAMPLYADRFPVWSEHSTAILAVVLWTALEAEGLGANLQHYNPLIDEKVAAAFDVPANWALTSQLVFGTGTAPAGEKEFAPIETRVKVFGAK